MTCLILHKLDGSPSSRAAQMGVELLGLKVHMKSVSIAAKDHLSPEYLKKNPIHTVPVLEDGNFVLADSHAILSYLTSKYGGEKREWLYPSDLKTKALIDQRMYLDASLLFPRLRAVVDRFFRYNLRGMTARQAADIQECYDFLERYLRSTVYLVCDHLTIADVSCVATVSSLNSIVPIDDKYDRLRAWWDRLREEEWYQRGNAPGLKGFDEAVKRANDGHSPAIVDI